MRRGAQQASEGCSSKAGPSWVLACLADHKPPHLIRFDSEDVLPSLPALMYVRLPALVTLGERARSFGRYSSKATRMQEAGGLTYVRAQKFGEPQYPPKLLQVSGGALTNVVRPPLLVCVPEELWQKPSSVTPPLLSLNHRCRCRHRRALHCRRRYRQSLHRHQVHHHCHCR